jgi:hypothetical protein
MLKGLFTHVLALACVRLLAAARFGTNLPSDKEVTERAQLGANLFNPPSFLPYTYAGCYADVYGSIGGIPNSGTPLLSGQQLTSNSLTYATCAQFCVAFTYFGVENGNRCRCGNSLPPTTLIPLVLPVPNLLCSVACAFNLNLVCAASGLLVIFRAPAIISSIVSSHSRSTE